MDKPVLIAGDPEREEMKKADRNNGISYHFNQITFAVMLLKLLITFLMNFCIINYF